eukprot:Skav218241  [mRNA]  locus=scaffold4566:219235:221521:+ [translate_table: standard]
MISRVTQTGDNSALRAIELAYLGGLLLYYGMKRLDLVPWSEELMSVLLGLKFGSVIGVAYGFFHGLVVVDPENHGLRSVFWAGLIGFSKNPPSSCYSKQRVAWPGELD